MNDGTGPTIERGIGSHLTRRILAVACLVAILVAAYWAGTSGRGLPGDPGASACDQAYAQAMAIDPASVALDQALVTCPSLEAWVAAAQRDPDTQGDMDPVAIARDRCEVSEVLTTAAICAELGGD